MPSKQSAEPELIKTVLAELHGVLAWLGNEGNTSADESGDWQDYETEGVDLDELAYSYWTGMSYQIMFAALVLRLPASIRDARDVLALVRTTGYAHYKKTFMNPSSTFDRRKPAGVTIGKQRFVVSTSYDDKIAKQASALISGKKPPRKR